jgi:hypothetical protein
MDEIRKLQRILNEEDGDVVSNDIPVALFRVKLDREPTDISHSICRAAAAQNCAESREERRTTGRVAENTSCSILRKTFVHFKCSEGSGAASVDDSLGNAFMVESMDLLTGSVVFKEYWASFVLGGRLQPVI